jgi:hypothetical protein
MLEHPTLWLSAPTAAWPPGVPRTGRWLRQVLAADTRDQLGHVALTPGRWWPWPRPGRLAAYETPDGSLLFTARRTGWLWPVTAVAEADGKVVALVYGQSVVGPSGRGLALVRRDEDGRNGRFVTIGGRELACWRPSGAGTELRFAADVRSEPFIKMGLLTAVLVAD